MFLILFVLNNPDLLANVLNAWEMAGVSGITILPSTGLGRIRQNKGLREDLPLIPSLEDFYRPTSDVNNTLFTVVEDDAMVEKVLQATEATIGSLNKPRNGILVVLPVAKAYGLIPYQKPAEID